MAIYSDQGSDSLMPVVLLSLMESWKLPYVNKTGRRASIFEEMDP